MALDRKRITALLLSTLIEDIKCDKLQAIAVVFVILALLIRSDALDLLRHDIKLLVRVLITELKFVPFVLDGILNTAVVIENGLVEQLSCQRVPEGGHIETIDSY